LTLSMEKGGPVRAVEDRVAGGGRLTSEMVTPPAARMVLTCGMPSVTMDATFASTSEATSRTPRHARIEDLLTEQPTLAIPRLRHNA
jgi:hypothetical protein